MNGSWPAAPIKTLIRIKSSNPLLNSIAIFKRLLLDYRNYRDQGRGGIDDPIRRLTPMATEVELKFALPPVAMSRILRMPRIAALTAGPVRREKLESIYFDTADRRLGDRKIILRIRNGIDGSVQTIKSTSMEGLGGLKRHEWEDTIAGNQPDFARAKGTALEPLATPRLKRAIGEIFRTVVVRTAVPLRVSDAVIEMAIDHGHIVSPKGRERIAEMELELKSGDAVQLFRLGRLIAGLLPVAYAPRSKAERGYALITGARAKPINATPVPLSPDQPAGAAFQAIGLSCLRHVIANRDAVLGGDTEGLHQMRVGLRRLRSAIYLFRDFLQDAESRGVKRELKWLSNQFTPARDLDTFLQNDLAEDKSKTSSPIGMADLKAEIIRYRKALFSRVKTVIGTERYRRLVLRTAFWLMNGKWISAKDSQAKRNEFVSSFACSKLHALRKKLNKKSAGLDRMDARQRHKLRILVKKLHYGTGFFEPLYRKKGAKAKLKRFQKALKDMQDALGILNDITVHNVMVRGLLIKDKRLRNDYRESFALGLVTGREQSQIGPCLRDAKRAAGKLAEAAPFWD